MLLDTLGISLKEENTEANRKRWANFIIQHNTDLAHLLYLPDAEMPVLMRFTLKWDYFDRLNITG